MAVTACTAAMTPSKPPRILDAGVACTRVLLDAAVTEDPAEAEDPFSKELSKSAPAAEGDDDDSASNLDADVVLASLLEEEDSEFVAISMWEPARCKATLGLLDTILSNSQ